MKNPTAKMIAALVVVALAACGCGAAQTGQPPVSTRPTVVTQFDLWLALSKIHLDGASPRAQVVLDTALAQLGKKYEWGGNGPDAFDCSALVQHAFAAGGVKLPRVTYDQVKVGQPVALAELAPGDLIYFFKNGHVALYIGDGLILHAYPDSVKVELLSKYQKRMSAIRRI